MLIRLLLRKNKSSVHMLILKQNENLRGMEPFYASNGWSIRSNSAPALDERIVYLRGEERSDDNAIGVLSTRRPADAIQAIVTAFTELAQTISGEEQSAILVTDDIYEF